MHGTIPSAPRTIKLIINQPTLDFDGAEEAEVAQEIELSEDQVREGKRIPLRFVRFQTVDSLHVCLFSGGALCSFMLTGSFRFFVILARVDLRDVEPG